MTERDLQEQLEEAGFEDADVDEEAVNLGAEVTGEDILDAELEDESVPRDVIEEAVQEWEADRKYEQSQMPLKQRVQQGLSDAPNALKSVRDVFIRWPNVPATGTVTGVNGVTNGIEITVKPDGDIDNMDLRHATRTFTLDADGLRMKHLLSTAGVEKPSQLKGETVPVKPEESFDELDFDLNTPKNRAAHLPLYYWGRVLTRMRAYELKTTDRNHERIRANRNTSLLNGGLLSLIGGGLVGGAFAAGSTILATVLFLMGSFILLAGGLFLLAYVLAVAWSLLVGSLKLLFGDRR